MITAVLKRFVKRQGFDSAAILSFDTLFAVVPGLALGLSVFSLSPYFADFQQHLEQFLFTQLLPQNYDTAKDYIQQLIKDEPRAKPLSDQKIVDNVQAHFKLKMVRRTITKYREQLNIPKSGERKREYLLQ